jgi:activating signal cointegrator complex subunit 1
MSSSDKRRSPIAGSSSSPSRGLRSSSSPASRPTTIAQPPRAALNNTPSQGPDDRRHRENKSPAPLRSRKGSGQSARGSLGSSPTSNDRSGTGAGVDSEASGGGAGQANVALLLQQLQEKDDRLAELELALREERRKTPDQGGPLYWQRNGVATNTENMHNQRVRMLELQQQQTETELRVSRLEEDARPAKLTEMRAALDAARRDVAMRDVEIRELKDQVQGLKTWVSSSTRSSNQEQTSDAAFRASMTRLGNELQNWILVNFRRCKIGMWSRCCRVARHAWEN